ncbi:uncharacterized protein LOC143085631 isoform X2 [Mytilus galloprovincialis]|uniref:uncharacterized protein LOC143085631 isoform X2 n=1 Tax=Mytilus galloprovincialis TaxID=29158 RepID=UPI003F7CC6F1
MDIFKDGNEETFDKRSRIKQNVRVVSPSIKHKRILSRQHKSSHYLNNRISSAMSSDSNKIPPKIDNLRKEIARRASTVPNFLDCYDLKTVYDEANLRKKFREVVGIRNHTSPAVHQRIDPGAHVKNIYKHLNISQYEVEDTLNGLSEKDEKQFVEYMKKKQHASLSGLWNMAAWSVFEHRASRVHNIDELTMAILSKQMAIKKMREKISRKLELPVDKFKRIALLRQNVSFIEQKFDNMKQARPKKTQLLKTMHLFEQAGTSNMPSRFTKPGEAKAFFRKFGRIVLIVLNWIFLIMDSSESSRLERELKSFVDIAQEAVNAKTSQAMVEQGLSFDKQAYKANKEISLTVEHRKTLTTRASFRSPDMIKQVMHGLQALKSLADYPLRTQERLCQVAWYQTLGPKKVILREGHNAESFYFILAGTAFVKKMVRNERTGETKVQVAARLTKGQSFGFSWEDGEIGLIFNTKRTATVESTTPMELLVIGKEDFNAIFMHADDLDEEAEHVKFLRQVPILSQWPIECLVNEPGTCILHYFKRGSLITPNGRTSEWLYCVKSGTCEVMKDLKAARARKAGQSYIHPDPVSDIILPELAPRVDTGIAHKRKFVMTPEVFEEMSKYYEKLKQTLKEKKTGDQEEERDRQIKQKNEKKKKEQMAALPRLELNNQLTCIKDETEDNGTTYITSVKSSDVLIMPPVHSTNYGSKGVSASTFNDRMLSMLKMKPHYMFPTASMIEKEAPLKKNVPESEEICTVRKNSVFVHVQLLQAKDVFGLNTLSGSDDVEDLMNETPPLCLVSRGAEIVMLSKKVFLKYANDRFRRTLREELRPYPTESKLQDTFQTKVDWDKYKTTLLEDVLKQQCSLKYATGLV